MIEQGDELGDDEQLQEIMEQLFLASLESMIESGQIDPTGKSDEQLRMEAAEMLAEAAASNGLHVTLSHEETFLVEARRYTDSEQLDLANMFYVLWAEHWVNRMFIVYARRTSMGEEAARDRIRQAEFKHKIGRDWEAVFPVAIPEQTRQVLLRAARKRHEFVHYKWLPLEGALDERAKTKLERERVELAETERAVSALEALGEQILRPDR